jgi:hypothetical protein
MEITSMAALLNEPLVDRKTLARKLGVSPDTVQTWTVKKRIPHFRMGHRTCRYNYPSVVASLSQVYVPPTEGFSRALPKRKSQPKRPIKWLQLELDLGGPQLALGWEAPGLRK